MKVMDPEHNVHKISKSSWTPAYKTLLYGGFEDAGSSPLCFPCIIAFNPYKLIIDNRNLKRLSCLGLS